VARRLQLKHTAETRQKIQTSQLINRLTDHAFGKVEMSATQVRAAEILLRKTIPDLSTYHIDGQVTHSFTGFLQRLEQLNRERLAGPVVDVPPISPELCDSGNGVEVTH
jgi:hypothetical protein